VNAPEHAGEVEYLPILLQPVAGAGLIK